MKAVLKAVFTWLLVVVPLGWGVTKSVINSRKLFTNGTPAVTAKP